MKKELLVLWLLLFLPVLCFAQSDSPISLTATASQLSPFVGQRFTITASVINPTYESISGSLLVKGASGLTFFDPDAQTTTGNQWMSTEQTLPAKGGQVAIRFDVIGNEEVKAPIEIIFNYKSNGLEKKITTSLNLRVKPSVSGDGQCTKGETSQNACADCGCPINTKLYVYACQKEYNACQKKVGWWVYLIVAFITVLIFLGVRIIREIYIPHRPEPKHTVIIKPVVIRGRFRHRKRFRFRRKFRPHRKFRYFKR